MKPTILIVDDDSDTLDLFEIFLFEKFEIFTAANGFDALPIIKKNKIDIVLTDIMMTVMDGVKFLKKIRQIDGYKNVPVVAITAFSSMIQEKSLADFGFATVLSKPISRKILLETLLAILGDIDEKK